MPIFQSLFLLSGRRKNQEEREDAEVRRERRCRSEKREKMQKRLERGCSCCDWVHVQKWKSARAMSVWCLPPTPTPAVRLRLPRFYGGCVCYPGWASSRAHGHLGPHSCEVGGRGGECPTYEWSLRMALPGKRRSLISLIFKFLKLNYRWLTVSSFQVYRTVVLLYIYIYIYNLLFLIFFSIMVITGY